MAMQYSIEQIAKLAKQRRLSTVFDRTVNGSNLVAKCIEYVDNETAYKAEISKAWVVTAFVGPLFVLSIIGVFVFGDSGYGALSGMLAMFTAWPMACLWLNIETPNRFADLYEMAKLGREIGQIECLLNQHYSFHASNAIAAKEDQLIYAAKHTLEDKARAKIVFDEKYPLVVSKMKASVAEVLLEVERDRLASDFSTTYTLLERYNLARFGHKGYYDNAALKLKKVRADMAAQVAAA